MPTYPLFVKTPTQREAFNHLVDLLRPGQVVYTKVVHRSPSAMTRNIGAYIDLDNKLFNISWLINRLYGKVNPRKGGVKMSGTGTGMDMSFDLVFNLSRAIWHEGYPCNGSDGNTPSGLNRKKPRCQSIDHTNGEPYKSGTRHRDGGYALKHATM